jgi:hypothetical protein
MRPWTSLALLGLGACTSILGIEDLHEGSRPGSGGDPGSGASENTSGDSGKATTGGKTSPGGSPTGVAGAENAGAGNESGGGTDSGGTNSGGTDNGGAGNEAGSGGVAEPVLGTVTGKVIDRWGVPVGNVTVQIDGAQVSTDAKGGFSIDDVAASYDLSLLIEGSGWVYQDLTRRDPTLQVYRGHAYHYSYVDVTSSNATLGVNDQLSLSAGTATGTYEYADIGIDSSVSLRAEWEGGTSIASTLHGLEWTKNAATDLPSAYKAYDSKPLALASGVDAALTLNLMPKAITSQAITGTVTPRATPIYNGSRTNSVFVRFSSGGSIQVVEHKPTLDSFSYLVPTLADSSITVAAWEGSYYGPLGLAHRDGLSPGAAVEALEIPAPPSLLTPPGGATGVDENTSFSFKASPDNAGAFVVIIHSLDTDKRLFIVTTRQKLTRLPSVVDGAWLLEHGSGAGTPAEYEWWVETHGSFATVDAMTGPAGYVDEFGVNYITPEPLNQKDGTYTYSPAYQFTTKNQ